MLDTPGGHQYTHPLVDQKKVVREVASEAMTSHPEAFDAMALVVRFGERFSQKHRDTVNSLKSIWGEEFFRKKCIPIMTHGDFFERVQKIGKIKFLFRNGVGNQRVLLEISLTKFKADSYCSITEDLRL